MAQIPPILKLLLEDIPADNRSWMEKLVQPINTFISSVIYALSGNLTLGENVRAVVFTSTFTNNSSSFPIRIRNTMGSKPTGTLILKADNLTNPATVPTALSITDWQITNSNDVAINSISGLTANNKYQITFLVL